MEGYASSEGPFAARIRQKEGFIWMDSLTAKQGLQSIEKLQFDVHPPIV